MTLVLELFDERRLARRIEHPFHDLAGGTDRTIPEPEH
jgi:hypothetical protein